MYIKKQVMAIKDRKTPIPTPTEVKNSPHPLDEKEITQLRELRDRINKVSFQFGQLYMSKIKLEENENILKKELSDIENEQKNIGKKLTNIHGKGTIDLDSGTFTPLK